MLRRAAGLAFLIALLALAIAPAFAQTSITGSIQGVVKNEKGAVVPDATVVASSDALVARQTTAVSDKRGGYRFPSLPPGTYVIEVQGDGYNPSRREGVVVRVGQAMAIDFTLRVADVKEEITVTSAPPVVSVVSNTVSTNFDTAYITKQPLPRNYYNVIQSAPGVNLDYTSSSGSAMIAFGGTTESQNAFTLDGVNVADSGAGQHWVLPAIQWMETIEVGGLGASAEYGGYTGGIINGVTKSGGNVFSGSVEAYYQPESWVADNTPDATGEETFKFQDYAFALGGPVVKDNLWFFVSGEYWNQVRTPYSSGYFQTEWGIDPPGEKTSDRQIPRVLGKLTWQANASNRLMLMTSYEALKNVRRGVGEFTWAEASSKQDSPGLTMAAHWESIVGANNFFNVKLTGYKGNDDYLPYNGTQTPGRVDDYEGLSWVNQDIQQINRRQSITLDASWTLFKDQLFGESDSHNFKFGALYEDATSTDEWRRNGGFTYVDYSRDCGSSADYLTNYLADPTCGPYYIQRGDGEYNAHPKFNGFAGYAQDSMRVGQWTVNAGVRFGQYNGGWQSGFGDSKVYDVTYVDPRLGAVWDVRGDGRTALKAHFGRYHDKMYTYLFDREASGNATIPDQTCDFDFDTGEYSNCGEPTIIAAAMGNVDHPYVDEIILTFEQQFGKDMVIGVDLIDRGFRKIMTMRNVNDDYTLVAEIENPLGGGTVPIYDLNSPPEFVLTTDNGAQRDYRSAIVRFEKRYADRWQLRSSLVWTDLDGNILKNNGYANEWRDKNGEFNRDGRIDLSFSDWEFKTTASVDLPWRLQLSGQYLYYSGWYWTPYMRVSGLTFNSSIGRDIFLRPRGSEKLPARNLVDLKLAWTAFEKNALGLTLSLEAFNVFNEGTTIDVYNRAGTYDLDDAEFTPRENFGTTFDVERPREIRAGARLTF